MFYKIYKRRIIILLFSLVVGMASEGRSQNGVRFDPETGNYLIQYLSYETEDTVTVIYEPPTKIKPTVKATVGFNDKRDCYVYNYEVSNDRESIQRLSDFGVEYFATLPCSVESTDTPLQKRLLDIGIEYFVPVSDVTSPGEGWGGYHHRFERVWEWADTDYDRVVNNTVGIGQGESLAGFSFKSKGLPAIVECYFQGFVRYYVEDDYEDVQEGDDRGDYWTSCLVFPEEPPQEIEDALDPLVRFPNDTVRKKTVGPGEIPEVFEPLSFLDNLISLKEQAYSLGWIDNKGILNSLNQKLEAVRKNIQNGKIKTAKNILGAFINEVEAQKEKHLSSEAYALLKFNAQYLRENL